VCRTTPYSELGQHGREADAAFETDGVDHDRRTGWSVLAKGRLRVVSDRAELAALKSEADPTPWAAGARCLYLKLAWRELTGRRIEMRARNVPTPGLRGARQVDLGKPVLGRGRSGGQPPRW
jgi:hypothetical protein